ncbi:ComEC/Rec2 family competence protein [Altericroceibacterium spongiae]|uniref:ComEC/Rec2 family competence protein n=1 Tax=Altericroceibacterium spongiae TaxID=2320269 RepID=UPI001EE4FDED|nr:ComEC/Rec2 family competence protein [Altericroceibacterium spongiae]
MSSLGDYADTFLANAGFDRAPWLVVAFAAGIALWFGLSGPVAWVCATLIAFICASAGWLVWAKKIARNHLRLAVTTLLLCFIFGVAWIWIRSEMVGAEALKNPQIATVKARILERIEQPAADRLRLVLATRDLGDGQASKIRVNVPLDKDDPALREGAVIRAQVRLMPPAPPALPGGYDFARTAWFQRFVATGSVLGDVTVLKNSRKLSFFKGLQRFISGHVRSRLEGAPGHIAAAFASGDRGAISEADEDAMRDAGLTHLLSISGLHVSAIIAATYFLALKLLGLVPWLALRCRLPLLAAAISALAGIGYTLLTGAEVPTVRSCIGAVLVLLALAIGREPLSFRMVAVAAFVVLLLWPETLVGPSFQMSFSAVMAIIALHSAAPIRRFLAPREESWPVWMGRRVAMLLLTGIVIELALMPIVLFHFHRAGVYGALANVIAIPLVTFISMPLIALALLFDLVGLGGPVWWCAGLSLDVLLAIAHFTAGQPGAVKMLPVMGTGTFALFILGGLWLGLWRGRVRLLGSAPIAVATIMVLSTPRPDLLITGDGRHVAITGEGEHLLSLRDTRSDYTRDNLLELSGMDGGLRPLANWPGSECSRDFCVVSLRRGDRDWHILMARNREQVSERGLAAACERADIVIASRFLPRSCRPRWLKADRRMLLQTGGLSISLDDRTIRSVADMQGQHGWSPYRSHAERPVMKSLF